MAGRDQLSKDLTLAEFRLFRDYIHQHAGIYLEESKLDSLRISLVTRATRIDCPAWDQYFAVLSRDQTEFKELLSLITINETSFFRFPAQFDAMRDHVIPEIVNNPDRDDRSFRVWSAGCSTGEEPYTIAMTLHDSALSGLGWRSEVSGTDVSTKALGVARNGLYAARHVANLSPEVLARHFVKVDTDSWRVAPHVRRMCEFGYHNLIKEPYPLSVMGQWDVIFCRNVTIYFKLESTRRVVANFYNSLNDGGYLFVGHSETLTSISDQFEPVETGGVFLYRKARRRARTTSWPGFSTERDPRSRAARAAESAPPAAPARKRAERPKAVAHPLAEPAPAPDETLTVSDLLVSATRHLAEGESAAALKDADAILAREPKNADALLVAAHVKADTGDFDKALALANQAIAVNPLLAGARYVLGLIRQRQGDAAGAIGEFKKTVYIDPDFALAHMNLANLHRSDGKFDQACREYDNALRAARKDPNGTWTLYLGGWTADVVLRTCERSLIECRKAMGAA